MSQPDDEEIMTSNIERIANALEEIVKILKEQKK